MGGIMREGVGARSASWPEKVVAWLGLAVMIFVGAAIASTGWMLGHYWFMRLFYWVMMP